MNLKKFKLINSKKEEIICEEVEIDGFKYYQADNCGREALIDGCFYIYKNEMICKYSKLYNKSAASAGYNKKIIATNNPNLELPQIIDTALISAQNSILLLSNLQTSRDQHVGITCFFEGYKQAKDESPFSKEEMFNFADYYFNEIFNTDIKSNFLSTNDIFKMWELTNIKTLYYDENL